MRGTDYGGPRTLLLAPVSVAGQEETLRDIFTTFDRSNSDLQMLDRLAAGIVKLPEATYDLVVILTGQSGTRRSEAHQWLSRQVYDLLVASMKAGAILEAQDGPLPVTEPTLAGLVQTKDGRFEKAEEAAVQIRLGRKKKNGTTNGTSNGTKHEALNLDQFDDGEDLIDENGLLSEEDLHRPYPQPPPQCQPKPGRARRACKDCTCGLAERLNADDESRRAKADKDLQAMKLTTNDLNDMELDFTVKGSVGSCGSCSLGDAFRCAGCPYIGLPPFNPGDKIEISDLSPQL